MSLEDITRYIDVYTSHVTNYKQARKEPIKYIVLHYVGTDSTALRNAKYFKNNANLNVSAHYFVNNVKGIDDGEQAIYHTVPDMSIAWHCGSKTYTHKQCRNSNSIGIEMCCNEKLEFDEITVELTSKLVTYLMLKYGIEYENIIRHYDVTGKRCPAPYVNNEYDFYYFKNLVQLNLYDSNVVEEVDDVNIYYQDITEIPDWSLEALNYYITNGYIKTDNGALNLSYDMLRILVIMYRHILDHS